MSYPKVKNLSGNHQTLVSRHLFPVFPLSLGKIFSARTATSLARGLEKEAGQEKDNTVVYYIDTLVAFQSSHLTMPPTLFVPSYRNRETLIYNLHPLSCRGNNKNYQLFLY